jgi:hypothetical protein
MLTDVTRNISGTVQAYVSERLKKVEAHDMLHVSKNKLPKYQLLETFSRPLKYSS